MNLTKPQKLIYDMEKFAGGSIALICGSMLMPGEANTDAVVKAVNELFRINTALRPRIVEDESGVHQEVIPYQEKEIETLRFESKAELDSYAQRYAKEPLDFYGELCEAKIIILPEQHGILVKLHHIIGDAWSLALLGTQFNKFINGEAVEAYSYSDYAESEAKYAESNRYERDKSFFIEQFKKCDEVTYLNEKQSDSFNADRKTFIIDKEKTKEITDYTKKNNTSVFMLLTAVLSTYFSRVKMNAERFYIGTPVLNRGTAAEKNTVGMFINTVPMLIELSNDKSFAENLSSVEETAFSVLRHQRFNYGDILSEIRKEFNFTEKLYDVILSYQNATVAGEDIETTWYNSGMQSESLQIHIDDRDNEGILKIHYDYQTEKFTENEIEMLHAHFLNLLFNAIKNEDKKIYELEMLTEDEKQKLLFDFNDTAVEYPKDKCIHQLFEEQVEKTPDKTALIACDKTLTYKELNEEANRIAHSLIEKGIGVGDIVAFALPRKSYLIAVMFGILKSGAAYLPIDPDYPQDRIEYMLQDSNSKLFITEDNITEFLSDKNTINPNVSMSSDNICYCIYTSGSTGKPKGVLLKHKNVVNYVDNNNNNVVHSIIKETYKTIVSVTTVGFDIFVTESILPLANGMTTIFADEKQSKLQGELNNLLLKYPADVLQTTPTKMKTLISDSVQLDYLKELKVIILGGEALEKNLVDELKQLTNAEIFNIYGPTETTVWSTNKKITDKDITIGKPIANTQIYIVDKYMHPTPIGVTGELCIAGDGVGAGYLNRPELTAEKFIDNPFGDGKLYKTGDLAYWREDGNIMYVGRNDFQVKIRGLRIELGEIENAISSVDGIQQSVIIVRKNSEGRQLICAFYTGKEKEATEIKKIIGTKLPKYMLPHIFTHIDEMPLTSSGKVNRKALPEIDLENIESNVEYVAPVTEKEIALVSAVQSVLSAEKIGILDNFFDIGGDSLKAIELINKLESKGFTTDTKTIFDCENIKDLAQKITEKKTAKEKANYGNVIAATPAQLRVYTAQNMNSDSTLYNIPYVFRTENLDCNRLETAINKLISRHESLRTHFENRNGEIVQVIDSRANITVQQLESDDILSFVKPFDLSKSPLLRVGCFENTVMIDIHHIISDGGTMPVFFKELNELYMGREIINEPVQYGEFAVTPVDNTENENYWFSVFNDEIPVLEMNTDYPRTDKQSFNGAAVYDSVSIETHKKITEKCKVLGITPYVFYMAAFNILLSKYSGNEDIIVGMPVSGRTPKYLDTIGMFVNTVVLRNKPDGNKTVEEFLSEVKETSIEAISHQGYPFGTLIKKLGIESQGRNPLFDVMFAYQSEAMTDIVFGDKNAELLPIPITTSKCDFTFNIMPRNNDVVIMAEYCTDLYRQTTIGKIIKAYKTILNELYNEKSRLADISALNRDEKQKLLSDFNDTAVDYPKDKCIHQLFEEQVEKTPDKAALIACDKTLTYRGLNEEANRIANSLIAKGVGVGDIVAIKLTRKSYLLSAMFGVLKTSAAYMPIDPSYPEDRIQYMLSESKAKYYIDEDNIFDLLNNESIENPNCETKADDIFCALHTSGSTGKPKMSLLKQGSISNFITANKRFWNNVDTVVSATIVTFDAFQMDSILTLAHGIKLILASENEIYNQTNFETLFKHSDNNMFFSTPTKIENYIDNSTDKEYLRKIKSFVIGGEIFSDALLSKIKSHSPYSNVYNIYGPTECTICALVDELEINKEITIGKPIANTQIYIVDKYMHPTPIGVTGELCIAGDGVGAGYLNRPELTAEKFIDNPFGDGKLYKTGDLAYWREDGNIMYVCRNDFQVKIRGLRIELGEIENAISSVDGIQQSVVIVRKNSEGRQLICAFYTGKEKEAAEIKKVIGAKLPKYMLPHIFTYIDEMPLTSSGKVNRKVLPEIDLDNIESNVEYVAPKTELQKALCRLIKDVLSVEKVGLTDNFFDLGGDSLKAIEFISKAHSEGIYFELQNVFDYPAAKELCDCIENGDRQIVSFDNVDFSKANSVLAKNTIEHISKPEKAEVGNILLAGATGFLGIHILADFLDNDTGDAYCLVRGKDKSDSENRFTELLKFYFGDKYSGNNRIKVICADLSKDKFGLADTEYSELLGKIDTVINCAASVKHYGSYKYFYEANVETTKRLIDFTKETNAKLIHTSTLSVSGNSFADEFDGYVSENIKHFYESSLYIGQPLNNVYARSKFEAEKAVLDAMSDGLQANIMRMGNLTNRYSDGMFQKNYQSNAFLNRVKAILELGMIPDYLMDVYAEFTPIDEAANAVMTIARYFNNEQTVFHINSTKVIYLDKLFEYFNSLGFSLKSVNGVEFTAVLQQTAKQSGMEHIFETFINDMDENDKLHYDSNIHIENDFTVEYLKSLGFEWKDIDLEYLRKYVEYFRKIGYFGGN